MNDADNSDDPDTLSPLDCCVCTARCFGRAQDTIVCAECVPRVEALYEAERRLTPSHQTPGWFLVNDIEDDGAMPLNRDDELDMFESDDAAGAYVAAHLRPKNSESEGEPMFPMATVIREHLTCAFPETETMTFDDAIGHLIEQHTQMRMQAISASGVSETQALLPLDKELVLRALAEKAAGDRKAATELGLPVGVVGARLEHWADRADRLIDTLKATTVVLLVDAS